ncbi:VOC family protein [Desulfatitalea alkaliphila]|uniref:VOC family protein n=1 Tax=Desulfatitalea alkaliphila TaxID=2929485 RepID=A0AA41R2Q7_9BACT|nr:VOC family protein [Desulfatitalea alkaliphila]MCJ8499850.1 VOC family protein [Desulfatitalea alkaliphila]
MAGCRIDHLVITAPSLGIGAAFIKEALGVDPQAGGSHPSMGTHNLLLSLGDALYLEVISIDPSLPAPDRPRWFGMDNLSDSSLPALSTWVARTADIRSAAGRSSESLGSVTPMQRGDLNWLITIPPDGLVPLDGVAPALIEWPSGVHPAARLADRGLRLVEFEIFHPDPKRVQRLLSSIDAQGIASVAASSDGTSSLSATISTPEGLRYLSSGKIIVHRQT